jgi:hypothetical protein
MSNWEQSCLSIRDWRLLLLPPPLGSPEKHMAWKVLGVCFLCPCLVTAGSVHLLIADGMHSTYWLVGAY